MQAIFTSAANRDVKRALDYYKSEAGAKVAENFIDRLESAIARILRGPESYRIVTRDLRCANLDRFPYQVVYRIASESTVKILSVRHHKRHPDFGLNR
jgi:plasmid stabilization system protein ParE